MAAQEELSRQPPLPGLPAPLDNGPTKLHLKSHDGGKNPWKNAELHVSEIARKERRKSLFGLGEVRRQIARDEGHRCPDCPGWGKWDPGVAAVICNGCGQQLSKSAIPRGVRCGMTAAPTGVRIQAFAALPIGLVRASYVGVYRCGAAWSCPTCAKAKQADDAEVLQACNLGFRSVIETSAGDRAPRARKRRASTPRRVRGPGEVYMLTLTVPHRRGDALKPMRQAITRAWTHATHKGKKAKLLREAYRIAATVRRVEVTAGPNGWHPHIHAMLFCRRKLNAAQQIKLKSWYLNHFGDAVEAEGYERPVWSAIHLCVADKDGKYLAKMGLLELAGDVTKTARCGRCAKHVQTTWLNKRRSCSECGGEANRNAWQILADYAEHGEERDRRLWAEYCREILGARRLTWSRWKDGVNLRTQYTHEVQVRQRQKKCRDGLYRKVPTRVMVRRRDIELALQDLPRVTLTAEAWRSIRTDPSKRAGLLECFEAGDKHGFEALLGEHAPNPRLFTVEYPLDDPRPPSIDGKLTPEEKGELAQAGIVISGGGRLREVSDILDSEERRIRAVSLTKLSFTDERVDGKTSNSEYSDASQTVRDRRETQCVSGPQAELCREATFNRNSDVEGLGGQ